MYELQFIDGIGKLIVSTYSDLEELYDDIRTLLVYHLQFKVTYFPE